MGLIEVAAIIVFLVNLLHYHMIWYVALGWAIGTWVGGYVLAAIVIGTIGFFLTRKVRGSMRNPHSIISKAMRICRR